MARPKVLILEDDPVWLNRHRQYIAAAGFEVCSFYAAEEAIACAKGDPLIRCCVVDHILLTQGNPDNPEELQRWQGTGMIREIYRVRHDLLFALVTEAPRTWERNHFRSYEEGIFWLEKDLEAIGMSARILYKGAMIFGLEEMYRNLTDHFWRWIHKGYETSSLLIFQSHYTQVVKVYEIKFEQPGNVFFNSPVNQAIGNQHNYATSSDLNEI
jgi:hypothetical protein